MTEESRGLTIPIEAGEFETEEAEPLDAIEVRRFRGIAARLNYLSQDRPDIQFATKEVCRDMARPTVNSMKKLKRMARYLLEVPTGVIRLSSTIEDLSDLRVYVDSDWAGCKATRKSTSGGAMTWGGGLLKSWARTQGTQALSSGEAEFCAAIKGSAEAIGMQSILGDMGIRVRITIYTDSSAAKGTASRIGIGKVKHLDVGWLWIQESVRKGQILLRKIDGRTNPGDLMTKPKSAAEAIRLSELTGYSLVIREPRGQKEETFAGFLTRIMKGSVEDEVNKAGTRDWWIEKTMGAH